MTNQDQPDLPNNEGDTGSDDLAELDVDALLDQATSLADELSGEVGESADEQENSASDSTPPSDLAPDAESTDVDATAAPPQADIDAEDSLATADQVDRELDDLQSVLDTLGVEVSDETQDETGEAASLAEGNAEASDSERDASDSSASDASAGDVSAEASALVESDLEAAANDLGLDTTTVLKPPSASPGIADLSAEELALDGPAGSENLDEPGGEPPDASGGGLIGRLAPLYPVLKKAEPIALRLAAIVAFFLEKLNRPFGIIGDKIRSIFGLLAIATTATAIVVFVVSLL